MFNEARLKSQKKKRKHETAKRTKCDYHYREIDGNENDTLCQPAAIVDSHTQTDIWTIRTDEYTHTHKQCWHANRLEKCSFSNTQNSRNSKWNLLNPKMWNSVIKPTDTYEYILLDQNCTATPEENTQKLNKNRMTGQNECKYFHFVRFFFWFFLFSGPKLSQNYVSMVCIPQSYLRRL